MELLERKFTITIVIIITDHHCHRHHHDHQRRRKDDAAKSLNGWHSLIRLSTKPARERSFSPRHRCFGDYTFVLSTDAARAGAKVEILF